MGFLTDYEDSYLIFQGRRYKLDLAYDTVLNVQRMFQERKLDDSDMLTEALKIFHVPKRCIRSLTWQERSELLQAIYEEKIQTRPRPRVGKQQKLFDFEDDGEYIYASFMQDYGIDLIAEQGKLPWRRFIALFQGLTPGTKIKEVMKYRAMEVPKPNKNNQKEIQEIMELKAYYALGYQENNAAEGLEKLFTTLEGMAT